MNKELQATLAMRAAKRKGLDLVFEELRHNRGLMLKTLDLIEKYIQIPEEKRVGRLGLFQVQTRSISNYLYSANQLDHTIAVLTDLLSELLKLNSYIAYYQNGENLLYDPDDDGKSAVFIPAIVRKKITKALGIIVPLIERKSET